MKCAPSLKPAWTVLIVAGLAISAAGARTPQPVAGSGIMFTLENDVLARTKTDRWYTNAVRLAWQQGRPDADDQVMTQTLFSVAGLGLSNDLLGKNQRPSAIIWSLGQVMYTPQNIQRATPQLGDRPWAGWLYLGATA